MASTPRPVERGRAHAAALLGVDASRVAVGSTGVVLRRAGGGGRTAGRRGGVRRRRLRVGGPAVPGARRPARAARADRRPRRRRRAGHLDGRLRPRAVQHRRGGRRRFRERAPRARTTRACSSTSPRRPAGCRRPASTPTCVVCHTYKWLCSPRGSAFAAFSDRAHGRAAAAGRRLVLRPRPVGLRLRTRARPGRRRQPVRPVAGLARLGRRRGSPGVRRLARPRRGARPRRRPGQRLPRPARPRAVGQRDRVVGRPRRRAARRPARRRESSPPAAPAGRGSPSTSGTTRRTSTWPPGRSVAEPRLRPARALASAER